jgi:ribose 5-phosphate isomerase A
MTANQEKRLAAEAAINHVTDGMYLGVGTGSTVAIFIELLAEKISSENISITTVPSSYGTLLHLHDAGIPTIPLGCVTSLPVAVDGADEVDNQLALIKGGGAALLREKILAEAAQQLVIIVDQAKLVKNLGTRFPIPVEVLPDGLALAMDRIQQLGGSPMLRQADRKAGPVITDNGNFILDVTVPKISNPAQLDQQLKAIPGVIESGLFPDQADVIYVGQEKGVKLLQR